MFFGDFVSKCLNEGFRSIFRVPEFRVVDAGADEIRSGEMVSSEYFWQPV